MNNSSYKMNGSSYKMNSSSYKMNGDIGAKKYVMKSFFCTYFVIFIP